MIRDDGRVCYLNGQYLPLAEARVSVLDRGFIFGDAVYEVLPAPAGKVFAADAHLKRLARSLDQTGIRNPFDHAGWMAVFERLLQDNAAGDSLLYLQVTRGVAERDHAIPAGVAPTVFVMCKAAAGGDEILRVGAITLPDIRWGRCDIKSTSLLANVLLRNQAVSAGAYEALLVRDGLVTEGAASNVFVVFDGVVKTPALSASLLAGVTRNLLLDVLRDSRISALECDITADALRAADEIWLTSSSRDLVCVERLDNEAVGNGRDYPLAALAGAAFQRYKQDASGS